MSGASFNRPREADFLTRQVVQDRGAAFFQFGIETAVRLDDRFRNLGEERFVESDLRAEARRASDDHAADVIAPDVARHDAIRHEERRRARVVADDAVGREILEHLLFGMTCQPAQNLQRIFEEVGLVIGIHILQHRDNALEAHARVHVRGGERLERVGTEAVVLDEDQIPQFEESFAIAVDAADVPLDALLVAILDAAVVMDFGTRPAGTRLRHLPKIILAAEVEDVFLHEPGLGAPIIRRVLV